MIDISLADKMTFVKSYIHNDIDLSVLKEKSNINEQNKNKKEDTKESEEGLIDFKKLRECPCGYSTLDGEKFTNHAKDCPIYQLEQNKEAKKRLEEDDKLWDDPYGG